MQKRKDEMIYGFHFLLRKYKRFYMLWCAYSAENCGYIIIHLYPLHCRLLCLSGDSTDEEGYHHIWLDYSVCGPWTQDFMDWHRKNHLLNIEENLRYGFLLAHAHHIDTGEHPGNWLWDSGLWVFTWAVNWSGQECSGELDCSWQEAW